jgi:hypothetical protein
MDIECKHDFQRASDLDSRIHNYMLTVVTGIAVKLGLTSM